jgi:hypothetical protein
LKFGDVKREAVAAQDQAFSTKYLKKNVLEEVESTFQYVKNTKKFLII